MSFPSLIRAALTKVGDAALPGRTTDQAACEGSKHHSPSPLLVREVQVAPGQQAWLCGTCEGNLSVLQHLLVAHDGALPWPVRRCFGNLIRALAERSWRPQGTSVRLVPEESQ